MTLIRLTAIREPRFLYRFGAVFSCMAALSFICLAAPLGNLVGWPPMQTVLTGAGIFLVPWALYNWAIGAATGPDSFSLFANISGDALWVLLSVLLLVLYSSQMTALGIALIILQALSVSSFFVLKLAGVRALRQSEAQKAR